MSASAPGQSVDIIGRAQRSAAGTGLRPFWDALCRAEALQAEHPLYDERLESPRYVGIQRRGEPSGDLATAWLEQTCLEAINDAGLKASSLPPRTALLAGSSLGGMTLFEADHRQARSVGAGLPVQPTAGWRALYDGPTREVARRLATRSGGWTVNTACSSAANALGLARRWLLDDRIDLAIVAGFDVISPFVYSGFHCLGAVDPEPTTPFAADRRGLNLGEAAVAFVLARPAEVGSDVAARIIGYGSSCDAHHLTRPDLGGAGLARAVRACLRSAGLTPGEVDLLSAHGTGTPYNDTMEAAAFADVFARPPPIHCAKPVFGHTLGAAGAVDALAVTLMLEHQRVPRTFLRGAQDDQLAVRPSWTELELDGATVALSTSSGFGGSNAALAIRGAA